MRHRYTQVQLGEVLTLHLDRVDVELANTYEMVGVYSFGRGLFEREPVHGGSTSYKFFYRLDADHIIMSQLFGWEGALALSSKIFAGKFVSPQFPTFLADDHRLDRRFLGWYIRRKAFWRDLGTRTRGMGDRRRTLNPDALLAMEIPLPPLEEQQRIVAKIERLAARIEDACRLRPVADRQLDLLLPESIDHVTDRMYQMVTLDEAVDQNRAITYGIVQAGPHDPEGVPYIRVSDMQSRTLSPMGMLRTAPEIARRYRRSSVRTGDVVFAIRATVGKVRVVPPDLDGANLTQGTARLSPSERALGGYLFWSVQSSRALDQIDAACKGSTFREITLAKLRKLRIPLPPLEEQRRIIAYLDGLQAKVARLKGLQAQSRAELDALLPAILDRAFKGEL